MSKIIYQKYDSKVEKNKIRKSRKNAGNEGEAAISNKVLGEDLIKKYIS